MFTKYLVRELSKRKKQTALIASGLAIAIALVMTVSSVASGIKDAQTQALSSLYGIGTDIAVSKTASPSSIGQRFSFGAAAGAASGSTTKLSQSRLSVSPFTGTLTQKEVSAISAVSGVKAAVASLQMESTSFSGTLPSFNRTTTGTTSGSGTGAGSNGQRSAGGGFSGGFGGGNFNINRFSVEGITVGTQKIGPLATIAVTAGRTFTSSDANKYEAVIDASYAASSKLKVGSTLTMGGKSFSVIGIIKSTSTSAETPSNVYIPIAVAQTTSSEGGVYTNVYVEANSSQNLAAIKTAIQKVAKSATVSTSADLASTVSGSLSTASNLVDNMGGWLSAIVLLAAFATSILFTTSGVNRRIREFGTLKAIGWRSRRVVGQVVGESMANGIIGGIAGILLGFGGIWAVNNWAPTLSASLGQSGWSGRGFSGGFGGGTGGGFGGSTSGGFGGSTSGGFGMMRSHLGSSTSTAATNITLHASVNPSVILLAIAFAIVGGLLAGAFGGLRAARLSPATALRSVE